MKKIKVSLQKPCTPGESALVEITIVLIVVPLFFAAVLWALETSLPFMNF